MFMKSPDLNAANVHNLRFAAELIEYKGRQGKSRQHCAVRRAELGQTRSGALCPRQRHLEMPPAGRQL